LKLLAIVTCETTQLFILAMREQKYAQKFTLFLTRVGDSYKGFIYGASLSASSGLYQADLSESERPRQTCLTESTPGEATL